MDMNLQITSSRTKRIIISVMMVMVLLVSQAAPIFATGDDLYHVSKEKGEVPKTKCATVLLYDTKSGQIIYEKKGDVQRTPASITKIMTCMLVLENLDMAETLTVKEDATSILGHNMELKVGEKLTVEQLLKTLMVYSANDAAIVLADEVAGSQDEFIKMMNDKAKELGAAHTNFISVNGLTESFKHTTTAEDLVLITNYALESDEFRKLVKIKKYTVPKTNLSDERKFTTTNKLLYDEKTKVEINGEERPLKYDGTFGIKTGMMLSSGHCFVGGAKKGGTELVAICLLGATDNSRFIDAINLFEYGFNNYKTKKVLDPGADGGKVKIKYGHKTHVNTEVKDGLYATVARDDEEDDVSYEVDMIENLQAPIKKGSVVGTAKVYDNGKIVSERDVTIAESVEKGGPWAAWYISDVTAYIIMAILSVLLILIVLIARRKRRIRRRREARRARARQ